MVGPWQTPVADVAVTSTTMDATTGESMAIGERTPLAILDAPASGRIAIGECLTNIAASHVGRIGNVKLSANWMVAAGETGEDANLFDTVKAVGMELCPALGICIPVGKDSMSMRTSWQDSKGNDHKQVSPLSLMVTGFSSVEDVRRTATPDLKSDDSVLLLLDLGDGKNRLGGSALAQVYNQIGSTTPDLDDPEKFKGFFAAIQELLAEEQILSYHDRGDGGSPPSKWPSPAAKVSLVLDKVTGRQHSVAAAPSESDVLAALFAEELGAVIELDKRKLADGVAVLAKHQISDIAHLIGHTSSSQGCKTAEQPTTIQRKYHEAQPRVVELTYHMQLLDNPACAKEEFDALLEDNNGILIQPTFDLTEVEAFLQTSPFKGRQSRR